MSTLAFDMEVHISTHSSNRDAMNFSKTAANYAVLSRMIDDINLLLRPKGDQQFHTAWAPSRQVVRCKRRL